MTRRRGDTETRREPTKPFDTEPRGHGDTESSICGGTKGKIRFFTASPLPRVAVLSEFAGAANEYQAEGHNNLRQRDQL